MGVNSAEHSLFGIKIEFWSRRIISILSLVLIFTFTCKAGELTDLVPIPQDQVFQQERSLTVKVLSALLYEKQKKYKKAGLIWRGLSKDSSQVQDHVFYSSLASNLTIQSLDFPKTDQSKLFLSRFLSWQRRWQQALSTLSYHFDDSQPIENKLEVVRLNLVLGHYVNAKNLMARLNPIKHREQMQLEIYKVWLNILEGNKKDSLNRYKELEDNFLYFPLSSLFPGEYLGNGNNSRAILAVSLMRFPSNSELFEQLVKLLAKKGLWNALDELIYSQQFVNNKSVDWSLLAEIYLNTGQYKRLQALIKSRTDKYAGPEYYDMLARFAINRKNWELLLQVSKIYQSRFPKLNDGVLYQAIYFQETGRLEESKDLTRQAAF